MDTTQLTWHKYTNKLKEVKEMVLFGPKDVQKLLKGSKFTHIIFRYGLSTFICLCMQVRVV